MKLNSTQVAEKLGCTSGTVLKLLKNGKLTDLKPRKDGTKKHFPLFNSVEVNEFAKTYKNHKSNNSGAPVKSAEPSNGIMSRLNAIEDKLNTLIRLWS